MTEIVVVEQTADTFDTVEIAPDARTEYEDGELTALFPSDADTREYVVGKLTVDADGRVDVPDGGIVLDVSRGDATVLVPRDTYGGGNDE